MKIKKVKWEIPEFGAPSEVIDILKEFEKLKSKIEKELGSE